MKNTDTVRSELKKMNQSLGEVHKSLLQFQKQVHEGLEEKRLSVHDLLHLAINHPDFSWLRQLSMLMTMVDENLDDEKADLTTLQKETRVELRDLFFGEGTHAAFKSRLELATKQDVNLYLQIADLRKHLIQ